VLKKYYLKNIKQITLKEEFFSTDATLDSLLKTPYQSGLNEMVNPIGL